MCLERGLGDQSSISSVEFHRLRNQDFGAKDLSIPCWHEWVREGNGFDSTIEMCCCSVLGMVCYYYYYYLFFYYIYYFIIEYILAILLRQIIYNKIFLSRYYLNNNLFNYYYTIAMKKNSSSDDHVVIHYDYNKMSSRRRLRKSTSYIATEPIKYTYSTCRISIANLATSTRRTSAEFLMYILLSTWRLVNTPKMHRTSSVLKD